MGVTKEMNETARQWSNAAVKKNYVRARGNATWGIECKRRREWRKPKVYRCRLLAVEVVPAVQSPN